MPQEGTLLIRTFPTGLGLPSLASFLHLLQQLGGAASGDAERQHRTRREANDLLGDAAQQTSPQRRAPTRRQDDEVHFVVTRKPNHFLRRLAFADVGQNVDAVGLETGRDLFEAPVFPGRLLGPLVGLPVGRPPRRGRTDTRVAAVTRMPAREAFWMRRERVDRDP